MRVNQLLMAPRARWLPLAAYERAVKRRPMFNAVNTQLNPPAEPSIRSGLATNHASGRVDMPCESFAASGLLETLLLIGRRRTGRGL